MHCMALYPFGIQTSLSDQAGNDRSRDSVASRFLAGRLSLLPRWGDAPLDQSFVIRVSFSFSLFTCPGPNLLPGDDVQTSNKRKSSSGRVRC
jgi:hypothetical protein